MWLMDSTIRGPVDKHIHHTGRLYMDTFVRLLAVVGGAALGAAVVGFVVRFLGRFLGAKTIPRRPLMVLRALAAVACGWLVWLLVFGTGGFGLGGSGGLGRGGESQQRNDGANDTHLASITGAVAPSRALAIVMLGGNRVKNERFYVFPGEKTPKSLIEIKELVRQRQPNGLGQVEIMIYDNSVAKDHAAVTALEEWLRQNDISVKVTSLPGEAP
jgi:hypothetical protein